MFKSISSDLLRSNPLAFFTADQVIDKFPGYRIFIGHRQENELRQVDIWQIDSQFQPIKSIRADQATITPDLDNQRVILTLYNARWEERAAQHPEDVTRIRSGARAQEMPLEISLAPLFESSKGPKSIVNQTLAEIGQTIFSPAMMLRSSNVTPMLTEIQKRIAWSLSSFTFVLVGIPLALQTQRRETSVGVALSLAIVLVYYAIFIVAESMKEQARYFPELIIWLPNLIFQTLGFFLLIRANRK
jgi:lipopolysaccharide export system permease protein